MSPFRQGSEDAGSVPPLNVIKYVTICLNIKLLGVRDYFSIQSSKYC